MCSALLLYCLTAAWSFRQHSTLTSYLVKTRVLEFLLLNQKKVSNQKIPSSCFHPQEDTSNVDVPYCYYNSPDNAYSVADVKYTSSGVTANLTFNKSNLKAYEKSTLPISTLRLEVKYHTNHMLQFKVMQNVSEFVLFHWSKYFYFWE